MIYEQYYQSYNQMNYSVAYFNWLLHVVMYINKILFCNYLNVHSVSAYFHP